MIRRSCVSIDSILSIIYGRYSYVYYIYIYNIYITIYIYNYDRHGIADDINIMT